jgi:hypothetical protein
MKNKQKEWHTATKPFQLIRIRIRPKNLAIEKLNFFIINATFLILGLHMGFNLEENHPSPLR